MTPVLGNCVVSAAGPADGTRYFSLRRFEAMSGREVRSLPRLRRLLLENLGRAMAAGRIAADEEQLADLAAGGGGPFPFFPSRLLLQDASGIPMLQDFVALMERRAGGGGRIQLPIATTLVVDHGTEIRVWGQPDAAAKNLAAEIEQNADRYRFLKWCAAHISGLTVVEPGSGIIHSVNLERFCAPLLQVDGWTVPDSVIGSDSHTTMSNGAGVLSWGAGGIDMLGLMAGAPAQVTVPPIVRLDLAGALRHPAGAADAAFALAEFLRAEVAPGSVVEFDGQGVRSLSVYDRATIANMAPEYGTWLCLFPLDDAIRPVLRHRGLADGAVDRMLVHVRSEMLAHVACGVETAPALRFDLAALSPVIAGPGVPWRRKTTLPATPAPASSATSIGEGSVVLAAIASCTTTSNPRLLIEAGLLAKAAVARGLAVMPHVKTSFSPGSPALAEFLRQAQLLAPLERLGFSIAAYGCGACVGNSGALHPDVVRAIEGGARGVVAVLSGNRNFPHRIHPSIADNYLASPALVVAYAIAGSAKLDLARDPLGRARDGSVVHLHEILPSDEEVTAYEVRYLGAAMNCGESNPQWESLAADFDDGISLWDALAPRFRRPPFGDSAYRCNMLEDLRGARCLAAFGDEITTDHISPISAIRPNSAAHLYLRAAAVPQEEIGSFIGWRGNPDVMRLGTFSHPALENLLVPGIRGPLSIHAPSGICAEIPVVASLYEAASTTLIIFAGNRYGAGSARDWAAKGTRLLGVSVVAACSFERIHRANLVAAGVVPVRLPPAAHPSALMLQPQMTVALSGLAEAARPDAELRLDLCLGDRIVTSVAARLALESRHELEILRNGGTAGMLARQIEEGARAVG